MHKGQDQVNMVEVYLCLRLTNPNYAFMRRRLNSKRKVKEYISRFSLYTAVSLHEYMSFTGECTIYVCTSHY